MMNEKTSLSETIARSVEKVSDSKGLEAIGHGLGWGIAALAIASIFVAATVSVNWREAANKWDGHFTQPGKCFELQEVQGKAYRVNTCSGEVQELKDISVLPPLSSSAPPQRTTKTELTTEASAPTAPTVQK